MTMLLDVPSARIREAYPTSDHASVRARGMSRAAILFGSAVVNWGRRRALASADPREIVFELRDDQARTAAAERFSALLP
ncbi:hypothetical protein LWF01_17585 [Saxibacter everestensis]|uniref:Uncharacterized protein n=1 Tax=Saxibacter everestensis TaxID=2909229 RepID=A0ABY8QSF6_9MICO|nr:hypothetical protein LWF01_17585 [Brevibacteriaceae bacterium ZFBP1038]